jgi:hypothetical protein
LQERLAAGLKSGIYRSANEGEPQARERPKPPARPAQQPQEQEAEAADTTEAEAGKDAGDYRGDAAEDATSADDQAPSSWAEADRALWDGLSPEAKAVISRRDKEQTALWETRGKESAAERTKFAKAVEESRVHAQQQLAAVNAMFNELRRQTLGQEPDWEVIIRNDGSEAYQLAKLNWDKRKAAFDGLAQQIGQHMAGLKDQAKKAMEAIRDNERKALVERMPDWSDTTKADAKWNEIASYLTSPRIGFMPEQLGDLVDHRLYLVLEDALANRRLEVKRAKTAKQVKEAPARTASPGARQSTTAPEKRLSEIRKTHAENRNVRSLAGVIQGMRILPTR